MENEFPKSIPALKVTQWMKSWDGVNFDEDEDRRKPIQHFYVMSIPATILRALSGVERRSVKKRMEGGKDKGIQRGLEESRSEEIAAFVKNGYPWSTLSEGKRESPDFLDLKMPGWLPTAIVINIKYRKDIRASGAVTEEDLVDFREQGSLFEMLLPKSMVGMPWDPNESFPIEVIDGQHRLWAFEDLEYDPDFTFPVVAFHGLDIAWQAYLFYVINIKPKRINTSLAFDLYPLLREQRWLDRGEAHMIYREARSQELTEILWAYPKSPWYRRINMLGESGAGQVRQASWIRNLVATLVRRRTGPTVKIGGLFGASGDTEAQWNRTDQAAILIFFWQRIEENVNASTSDWAVALREETEEVETAGQNSDPAFCGKKTLLNTDQGIRGLLHVMNDMLMVARDRIRLSSWQTNLPNDTYTEDIIDKSIRSLQSQDLFVAYVNSLAAGIATFDWRTSDATGLDFAVKTKKQTYRGGTGYRLLRTDLTTWLVDLKDEIGDDASSVLTALGGDEDGGV